MKPLWGKPRVRIYPRDNWPFKIVEEPGVTTAIESARARWPRFDEIWEALVWLIAHGGHKIGAEERTFGGVGHYVYTYAGDAKARFPRIVVVYRWHLESFTIRMIVVSEREEV